MVKYIKQLFQQEIKTFNCIYAVTITIFWLEYLPYKKQKPFLGQATHVEPGLSSKSHFQFLFQIHLLASNLKRILRFLQSTKPGYRA